MSRGGYLAANVRVADLPQGVEPFDMKGGGQMMDLFASFPNSFFAVNQVVNQLSLQHVFVSTKHARKALTHLTEKMGFLERILSHHSGTIPVYKYRRAMTERQRERSMLSLRKTAISTAVQRAVSSAPL